MESFVTYTIFYPFNIEKMYWFVIPLILGFTSNAASAFTKHYSEKWGKTKGSIFTFILRNITGIPVWAAGFIMAMHESSGFLYRNSLIAHIAGWILIITGAVIIIIALVSIRMKAAAPSTEDSLVKKGIYTVIRHPIHSGTFLEFVGIFILYPSLPIGIATFLGCIWIFFQTKFEEQDLLKRIPEYGDYLKQVPRFFPLLSVKR
jgi:protein-S-isoprenylcysteine O-methyltransferase Ste14